MPNKKYTQEQIDYLRDIAYHRQRKEIRQMFNEKYNTNYSQEAINAVMKYYNIYNCLLSDRIHIEKLVDSSKNTRYKKGHRPDNFVEDGTITTRKDRKFIKIDGKFVLYNRYVYEQAHNVKLKDDDMILFLDNNPMNCSIDNLFLTNSKEVLRINSDGYTNADIDVKKAALLNWRLHYLIKEKEDKKNDD